MSMSPTPTREWLRVDGKKSQFYSRVWSMKVAHVPLDGTIPIYICGTDMDSMGYEEKAMKLKWECGGVSEK